MLICSFCGKGSVYCIFSVLLYYRRNASPIPPRTGRTGYGPGRWSERQYRSIIKEMRNCSMIRTDQINIRDPFVLVHDGTYYLYGTRGETCWGPADGFDVYAGQDLNSWEGPSVCFQNDGSFWADRNYWAPEVHFRQGAFYSICLPALKAGAAGAEPQFCGPRPRSVHLSHGRTGLLRRRTGNACTEPFMFRRTERPISFSAMNGSRPETERSMPCR